MTLKEFLENIQEMVEADPSILGYDVITSIDDEGNGFNKVNFTPSFGDYDSDGEFNTGDEFDCNAICVN